MSENKQLSIIICTFNRAQAVLKVLEELDSQFLNQPSPKSSQIIVIDNNSSDSTAEDIKNFQALKKSNIEINYFLEPVQGSSSARNRGIESSQGELLVFLDDDINLCENWLTEILKISAQEKISFVAGGRVKPLWASDLPPWLRLAPPFEIISSCFPAHDFGDSPRTYPFKTGRRLIQNPISACFLATRDVFTRFGNFREDLGIHGSQRGACEDTEFFWRVLAGGQEIHYLPSITVLHPIPPQRMTQKFILDWYELLGRTLSYLISNKLTHLNPDRKSPSLTKLLLKKFLLQIFYYSSIPLNQPAVSFWLKCQIAKTKGSIGFIKDSLKNEVLRRNPLNKNFKDPLPEPRENLGSGLKN
jgi:glycosyltransferase involved in cell wall biosynthesis